MNTIIVSREGAVRSLYDETLDLTPLGPQIVRRASHVEPDGAGRWHADLNPVEGPVLGPFSFRSEALAAEVAWLVEFDLPTPRLVGTPVPGPSGHPLQSDRDGLPPSIPAEV